MVGICSLNYYHLYFIFINCLFMSFAHISIDFSRIGKCSFFYSKLTQCLNLVKMYFSPSLWLVFLFWSLFFFFCSPCRNLMSNWLAFSYRAFDFAITFTKFSNPLFKKRSIIFFQYSIPPLNWLPSCPPFNNSYFLHWHIKLCDAIVHILKVHTHKHTHLFLSFNEVLDLSQSHLWASVTHRTLK